jgi:hypothetical protein
VAAGWNKRQLTTDEVAVEGLAGAREIPEPQTGNAHLLASVLQVST